MFVDDQEESQEAEKFLRENRLEFERVHINDISDGDIYSTPYLNGPFSAAYGLKNIKAVINGDYFREYNETLGQISGLYLFRELGELMRFMKRHPALLESLKSLHEPIISTFGPETELILSADSPSQAVDGQKLYLVIRTQQRQEEARKGLSSLESIYLSDVKKKAEGLLQVEVDPLFP